MNQNSGQLRVTTSAAEWVPRHLDLVAMVFVTTILVSNLAAQKLFQLGPATFTAGIIVFPISYIFGDVLTEVYGFKRARRVIVVSALANVFMALVLYISIKLPPANGWPLQSQFEAVHSLVPRIVVGSIAGYILGELTNSKIMSVMKSRSRARHLWQRTISSTFLGQFVDTAVFAVLAFGGVLPTGVVGQAIVSAWIFKVLYEVLATPATYLIVGKLKAAEGVEHFDRTPEASN
jgi:uncharacterized integral membrane protein (TIGR00697 family)